MRRTARCALSSDRSRPVTTAARLAADVAGDLAPELVAELEAWIASSGRVRAFVEANRTKIRHKLRGAADPEGLRDARAELLVAVRLLSDRRIDLAFEAYGSQGRRARLHGHVPGRDALQRRGDAASRCGRRGRRSRTRS